MKRIALFLSIAPFLSFALFLSFTAGACQAAPKIAPQSSPEVVEERILSPLLRNAKSVAGRDLSAQIFGSQGEVVLFLASIHGDESAGTKLVEELARHLRADPGLLGGYRALLVPTVNPDGVADAQRRNAHSVDVDRNFAARNFQGSLYRGQSPLSEPEAKFISDLVRTYSPVRILSFHQSAERIDYDGPGAPLAYRLAKNSPLSVKRMGERPGSLGAWAGGDLRIPTLTIELPRSADKLEPAEAWETYGSLLTEALLP